MTSIAASFEGILQDFALFLIGKEFVVDFYLLIDRKLVIPTDQFVQHRHEIGISATDIGIPDGKILRRRRHIMLVQQIQRLFGKRGGIFNTVSVIHGNTPK